jgi:hypothetical protein
LLPNYHEIKQSYQATSSEQLVETIVKEETSQKPHLNTALRAEILYFTTQGIRCAIANVEKEREEANRITENTGGSSSAKPGTLSREVNIYRYNAKVKGLSNISMCFLIGEFFSRRR